MGKRIIFSCILQLLVICSSCHSHYIDFDCETLQGLCPEEESHMSCSVPSCYNFHLIKISNDSCSRPSDIKVSFFLKECQDHPAGFKQIEAQECGKFTGTCVIQDNSVRLDLVFTATANLHGASATCTAQDFNNNVTNQRCIIKLGEVPKPPQNLFFNSSAVSWSEPLKSKGRADQQLQYHVIVNSSLGSNNETVINQTSYWLGVEYANASYISVCVSTQNCIGRSAPSCIEINQSFNDLMPPVPAIKAVEIIDNNVTLFWELNSTNPSNICYDIEMDSRIEYWCISERSFALLNVEKINNKTTIHFRVRANNISRKIAGEWTHLFCVTVYPLFPHILQKPQPELNSTDEGINHLTLMIRLQKKLVVDVNACQPQNTCTNVFIMEKSIEEDLEYTFNVTISNGKDQKLKVNLESDLFASSFQKFFNVSTPDQQLTSSDCRLCMKPNMLYLICFSLIYYFLAHIVHSSF